VDLDDVLIPRQLQQHFQLAQMTSGRRSVRWPPLKPETQRGFTAGLKVDGLDGRFDADLSGFFSRTSATSRSTVRSTAARTGGGRTPPATGGFELESSLVLAPGFRLAASMSLDDATYRTSTTPPRASSPAIALRSRTLAWRVGTHYAPAQGVQWPPP